MNINTLQYFITAAELSNFTKTAEKHYVAQTAISQQISKLEKEIGVPLFVREHNRVTLTDAGHVFYNEIKHILNQYYMTIEKVRICGKEKKKVITIGYTDPSELYQVSDLIIEFQERYHDCEIIIKQEGLLNLIREVKNGVCDLYISMSCSLKNVDIEGLEQYTIYHGQMLLCISVNHPWANRDYVEANELKDQKFIVLNVEDTKLGFAEMYKHCIEDGYQIQVLDYVPNIGAQLLRVELGHGVAFVQDLMDNPRASKLKLLPIRNSSHKYSMNVTWNPRSHNLLLNDFITFVKNRLPK